MNYEKIYNNLIEKAQNRVLEGYVERHHIVPRCMGGTDDINNLVPLTPEEHYLAHLLLMKIYPDVSGLIHAIHRMSYDGKRKLPNGKMYGWVRRKHSAMLSDTMKVKQAGDRNSQYGTCWVSNIDTKESFRINKNQLDNYLSLGFVKGRNVWKIEEAKQIKKTKSQEKLEKELQEKIDKKQRQTDNAYYWYNKLLSSDAKSIREFVRNSDYDKSHVSFITMMKKYVKEFDTHHGKPFRCG